MNKNQAVATLTILIFIFLFGFFIGRETKAYQVVTITQENNNTISKELQPIINNYENNYNNTFNNVSRNYVYFESRSELMNIIKENAEYEDYQLHIWDCINYTERGFEELKKKGYLVDKFATDIRDKKQYHALGGVYMFIDFTTGILIPPASYGYYGIDAGLLREWNMSKSMNYADQDDITKDSFAICRGAEDD